jgi:putative hemolysin
MTKRVTAIDRSLRATQPLFSAETARVTDAGNGDPQEMNDALRVLAVLALVAANAFFVIGEYAVVMARRSALAPRAEAGSAGARAALRLMDDPVRVISTVQVGITAVGILTGAVAEPLIRGMLGDALPTWANALIAFSIVTYLAVVLGELVPKALTLERAEALAALVARPVELISVALRPAVWVLERSAGVLLRPFGVREVVAGGTIRSADELRALVDEAEGAGVIPRAQEELLHNVFEFADREARDVMIPAPDVAWLDAGLSPDAALDKVLEDPHERYPVGQDSIGRLVGIVHVRDLIAAARAGSEQPVGQLARAPLVVPETKDLGALLREMREQRQQLAVVVDEYGASAGIVAVEDILEEIVGEIQDEYDLPDATLTWLDERTVLAAGSLTIDDANEALGTHLPQRGPRTLAGLTFDALGRRPVPGDAVEVEGVRLRVDAMDGLRIVQLRLTLPADPPATPEQDARCST